MPWGIIEDFLNEHGGPQAREIGWHELPLSVVIQYAIEGDEGAIEFLKQLPPSGPPPLKVAEHQSARTETFYNEDQERDERGRWGPGGGGGGEGDKASDPQREQANVEATDKATKAMVRSLSEPDGGFTIDPRTGETPPEGYAVADFLSSSITPGAEWRAKSEEEQEDIVDAFMLQNQDKFRDDPELKIGGWHNPENGNIVLDPSQVVADRTEAIERGWINDQKSVADLAAIQRGDWDNAIIPTHGSGRRRFEDKEAVRSYDDGRTHGREHTHGAAGLEAATEADPRDDRRGAAGVRARDRARDQQGLHRDGLDALEGRFGHLSAREVSDLAIGGDDWATVWLLAALELADGGDPAAKAWFEFNEEDHPRDERGRFGPGDGGGGDAETPGAIQGPGGQEIAVKGNADGAGTPEDPIYVDGDLDKAVELMAAGKSVRLDEEKQASILVDKLGVYARELRDKGEEAPPFDLCGVSAGGTNVFCADTVGVPRIEMPQLIGNADPDSPAALADPSSGKESNVEAQFISALEASGVKIAEKEVPASMLRPTQGQINGGKTGGMLRAMEAGTLPPGAIWTTKDGYVLDGHHRWSAAMALDISDGKRGDVPVSVREIDMEIGATLDFTNAFVDYMGMRRSGLSARALVRATARLGVPPTEVRKLTVADIRWLAVQFGEWNEEAHPRDDHGRFDGGGGGESSAENAKIPGVGNVKEFLDKNPPREGEKIFEYQSRITASLPPDARHELLFHSRERYPSVGFVREGASAWRLANGLPEPQVDVANVMAPHAKAEIVAEHFETTPDQSNDPEVRAAYDDFKRENAAMYDYMTRPEHEGGMGMKVDFAPFEKGDPYPSAAAQADDVRDNRHLTIQSGLGGDHSLMSVQEYDTFRAVHDTFGHAGTGAGFDRHGEYQTYLEHRSMYTGPAAQAMATEYHGSNSAIWTGAPETPGTGKSIILPESLIPNPWDKNGKLVKASGARTIFAASPEAEAEADPAIVVLADELGVEPGFAAEFDQLPWHFPPSGGASTPTPPPLR